MLSTLRNRLSVWLPLLLLLLFTASSSLYGFTKSGTTYTTNGSQADVNAAIADATAGDTINIPAGSFTWGTAKLATSIAKAITLAGAGPGSTTLVMDPTGPTLAAGVIRLSAAATARGFSVIPALNVAPFSTGSANGWRITNIVYNPQGSTTEKAYFCYTGSGYGIIDNCTITGTSGSNELIFGRGPSDSWQTPSSMGTANAVYIENCTFNGSGYVCDANANTRYVVRYCTITGNMKVDGHGLASNSPARGVRHMEIYGNTWSSAATFWNAMEIRGGTGMIFNNKNTNTTSDQHGRIRLTDYGFTGLWTNFGKVYQTLANYPVTDQIGVGMDPKAAGSEPMYLWNNRRGTKDWVVSTAPIPAAAIDLYRTQVGDTTATYTMDDVIKANRDYFKEVAFFDGTGGVGVGTKAQMQGSNPTKANVAFWVTDEADWDSTNAGNDGQLYVWNGSSWNLRYTPYPYPHPLASGLPPPVVNAPTSASVSPTSAEIFTGADISLTVTSDGTPPLTYQWRKNGNPIAGATSAILTLTAVTSADVGTYTVTVSNGSGSTLSNSATLTEGAPPVLPPSITGQPADQTAATGGSAVFSVSNSGTAPFTYQWRKNGGNLSDGGNISGSTSATLTLANATSGDAAAYSVVITNSAGSVTSNNASLTVTPPPAVAPSITSQPAGQTVVEGNSVVISVSNSGTAPYTYQWRKNGGNLANGGNVSGATTATLTLSNVVAGDAANYSVVVTNSAGSATSSDASLTVNPPPPVAPSILSQPNGQSVITGGTISLSVSAGGTAPFTYQWRKNGGNLSDGGNISGSTSSTLTIVNAAGGDAANYSVVVTNTGGNVTSSDAAVTVNAPAATLPTILTQPANQTVSTGATAAFSVSNDGTAPFTYQWRKSGINLSNGGNISGATSATLTITNAAAGDAANYSVVITNGGGSATSSDAALTVNPPPPVAPTITTQPSPQTVATGATAVFSVSANGTAPFTYQWRKNGGNLSDGGNISGATSATLTLANVTSGDAANYSVVVTNAGGSVTSSDAALTVNPPPAVAPSITSQPADQTVTAGTTVVLAVGNTGTAPFTYQWRKNGGNLSDGGNISGATSATLTLANTTTGDGAIYSVVITNAGGSVTSNNSTLTVNSAASTLPVIQTQPASQTGDSGDTIQLTVVAVGVPPLGYQWRKNGGNLSDGGNIVGATTSTLAISNATSADAATYSVVVTNGSGSVTSSDAVVSVNTPSLTAPSFLIQPANVSTTSGTNITLTAAADGTAPLTYQWRANGINITDGAAVSGSTTASLTITGATTGFTGDYNVIASNAAGSTASNIAKVVVVAPPPNNVAPTITTHPLDTLVTTGESIVLFAEASALPAATYQWQKDGVNLTDSAFRTGSTTTTLSITSAQFADGGTYRLVATNALGSATSNGAYVVIKDRFAPVVISQPVDQKASSGSAVFFSIKVTGFPDPSYQWRKNGANLSNGANILGANRATLSISNVSSADAANYSVVVKNGLGSITSNDAKLTVDGTPVISGQPTFLSQPPATTVAAAGSIVQLSVTAAGEPAPTLQWRRNGVNLANGGNISGVTTGTLTITGVTAADQANYTVVATNSLGSVTSPAFSLTVMSGQFWNQTVTTGKDVAISAPDASGNVQWQISTNAGSTWTNLSNDSSYSGVTTGTLHISSAGAGLNNALFRLVTVTNGETVVLHSALLNVTSAFVPFPVSLAADGVGSLYVADASNDTIEKINVSSQITTFAGTIGQTGTADGNGTAARFNDPSGVAAAADGTLVVADKANGTIRLISPVGVVSTLAGSTTLRGNVDGTGTGATFSSPLAVTRDSSGTYYVADAMNHTIRKITSAGVVTTLAGAAGQAGSNDGTGSSARFNNPSGIDVDSAGNVFVADTTNNLIRKVTPAGTVTTIAGLVGVSGTSDGDGSNALFNQPGGLALDSSGNVYVADTGNSTIRRISSAGAVVTVAGLSGIAGHKDGVGIQAWFNQPRDVAVSPTGYLYVADTGNASIRRIDQSGTVTTVALTAPVTTNPNPTNPLPETPTLPTTPTLPNLPTSPTPPTSGGGGGGGGGAPSLWFCAALAAIAFLRVRVARRF